MRTTRLRQKIKKFLDDRGEANTTEILEHVNSTMRHVTSARHSGQDQAERNRAEGIPQQQRQRRVDV